MSQQEQGGKRPPVIAIDKISAAANSSPVVPVDDIREAAKPKAALAVDNIRDASKSKPGPVIPIDNIREAAKPKATVIAIDKIRPTAIPQQNPAVVSGGKTHATAAATADVGPTVTTNPPVIAIDKIHGSAKPKTAVIALDNILPVAKTNPPVIAIDRIRAAGNVVKEPQQEKRQSQQPEQQPTQSKQQEHQKPNSRQEQPRQEEKRQLQQKQPQPQPQQKQPEQKQQQKQQYQQKELQQVKQDQKRQKQNRPIMKKLQQQLQQELERKQSQKNQQNRKSPQKQNYLQQVKREQQKEQQRIMQLQQQEQQQQRAKNHQKPVASPLTSDKNEGKGYVSNSKVAGKGMSFSPVKVGIRSNVESRKSVSEDQSNPPSPKSLRVKNSSSKKSIGQRRKGDYEKSSAEKQSFLAERDGGMLKTASQSGQKPSQATSNNKTAAVIETSSIRPIQQSVPGVSKEGDAYSTKTQPPVIEIGAIKSIQNRSEPKSNHDLRASEKKRRQQTSREITTPSQLQSMSVGVTKSTGKNAMRSTNNGFETKSVSRGKRPRQGSPEDNVTADARPSRRRRLNAGQSDAKNLVQPNNSPRDRQLAEDILPPSPRFFQKGSAVESNLQTSDSASIDLRRPPTTLPTSLTTDSKARLTDIDKMTIAKPELSNKEEKEASLLQNLDDNMAVTDGELYQEIGEAKGLEKITLPRLSAHPTNVSMPARDVYSISGTTLGAAMNPNFRYGLPIPVPVADLCSGCHGARDEEAEAEEEPILLCDREGCTNEFHLGCCMPPLSEVPDGSYYCIDCDPKGATSSLEAYFQDHEERRADHANSSDYQEWLFKQDLEENDNGGSISKRAPEEQIPQSELYRSQEVQNALWKLPSSKKASSSNGDKSGQEQHGEHASSTFGPGFFLGKPVRMHCPYDNAYHSGRIVDYRPTIKEEVPPSKLTSFVCTATTLDYEFLIRFPAGKDYRKESLHHWCRLEEHSLAVGTHLIWGKYKHFQPAMILMRTARELMPVKHMLREEEGEIFYQWSKATESTSLWALAKRFGGEEDGFKLLCVPDEAVDLFLPDPPAHRVKNKTLYALAVAEWQEEERVKKWKSLSLENPCGPTALRSLDEYLLEEPERQSREDRLCRLVTHGLDRSYLLDRLAQRGVVELTKDVAASLDFHMRKTL